MYGARVLLNLSQIWRWERRPRSHLLFHLECCVSGRQTNLFALCFQPHLFISTSRAPSFSVSPRCLACLSTSPRAFHGPTVQHSSHTHDRAFPTPLWRTRSSDGLSRRTWAPRTTMRLSKLPNNREPTPVRATHIFSKCMCSVGACDNRN